MSNPNFEGYPVQWVANCFLQYDFQQSKRQITPMKLQKLVYYLHGWHLASLGTPAIDSLFMVWRYGPVEKTLYTTFKKFGRSPITSYARGPDDNNFYVPNRQDTEFYNVFDFVVEYYLPVEAVELSARTHNKHGPWRTAHDAGDEIIDNDLIRGYFVNLYRQSHAA